MFFRQRRGSHKREEVYINKDENIMKDKAEEVEEIRQDTDVEK